MTPPSRQRRVYPLSYSTFTSIKQCPCALPGSARYSVMPTLPPTADIAIIGAGAIGCSIAYHLARRGVKNVVVLERDAIGSGTTSKAAGGIRAQFSTRVEIEFSLASLEFFHRFP